MLTDRYSGRLKENNSPKCRCNSNMTTKERRSIISCCHFLPWFFYRQLTLYGQTSHPRVSYICGVVPLDYTEVENSDLNATKIDDHWSRPR